MTETKQCPRCRQTLPREAFSPSRWRRSGDPCRICDAARQAAHRSRPETQAREAAYRRTPEAKALSAARNAKYKNTPKGRTQLLVTGLNYRKKPEAKRQARDRELRRNYGITLTDKETMLEEQDGRCRCCNEILHLDGKNGPLKACTDHTTASNGDVIVRGIICNRCNRGIGFLGDSVEGVLNAVRYLMGIE